MFLVLIPPVFLKIIFDIKSKSELIFFAIKLFQNAQIFYYIELVQAIRIVYWQNWLTKLLSNESTVITDSSLVFNICADSCRSIILIIIISKKYHNYKESDLNDYRRLLN